MAHPIAYDKAKWHFGGDFPEDLPIEQAYVHTGMYLTWLAERGLVSQDFAQYSVDEFAAVFDRSGSPISLYKAWDGALVNDMLSDEGNAFSRAYFDFENGSYLADYEALFCYNLPSQYHVEPTWENYDRLVPVLDRRLAEWRAERHGS